MFLVVVCSLLLAPSLGVLDTPLDLAARLGLSPPCRLYLLSGQVLDCPKARLSAVAKGKRLHLIALSNDGLSRALLDIGPQPLLPSPAANVKKVGKCQSLESLPPASVYRSPSACVASVLTGEALTYFYRDELEALHVKPICNGTFPVTGEDEKGEWFECDVEEDSVAGGELAELSALEGSIIGEMSSEPLDLPELTVPASTEILVVRKPSLGTITAAGRPVSLFTVEEAAQGQVVYNNFGGWGADNLLFQIWGVRFVYPIYILPTNQRNRRSERSLEITKQLKHHDKSSHKDGKKLEVIKERRTLDLDESGLMELTNLTLRMPGRPSDVFKLENPPKQGRILLRSEATKEFTVADITAQVVVYEHDGKETGHSILRDNFLLIYNSGDKQVHIDIDVYIHPIDDSPPRILLGSPLKVKEGNRATLTTRHIRVEDPDTLDKEITCYVIAQPLFGHIRVADRPSYIFEYSQLRSGLVTYVQSVHMGLEPKEDNLSVACYDAENNTESQNNFGTVSVIIESINDEAPTISPKSLHIPKGGEVALTQELIFPKDTDTPLENLTFTVESPPTKGILMKKSPNSEYQGVKRFSFKDMKDVYYRSLLDVGEDRFTLSVSDGVLESKATVSVRIDSEESPPQLLVNEGLEIEEGSLVYITTKILLAEDSDSTPDKIVYILRDTPLFGSLLLDDRELSPGSRFSQQEIASSRLSYRHTDPSSSMDVFVFDLTDGRNTLFNQNFFITILSVNQTYPVVTSETALIPPLSTLILTTDILKVKNSDNVEFHVMSPPRQGRLERRDQKEVVHSFTYADIEDEQIQYVHKKNLTVPEIIQFEVSDGKNSIFHTFNINFTGENSQYLMSAEALVTEELQEEGATSRPVVVRNNPIFRLEKFLDGTIGAFITKKNLYSEDEGKNITYVIADPPKYGNIYNMRTNTTSVNFTQEDVNNGRVMYVLNPEEKVPGDAALLNVIGQGYPLKGLQFILEWSWVHFNKNVSVGKENSSLLKVQLVRWGSLVNSAFVGIEYSGGNATVEDDFKLIEEQVQFSPGQSVAYLNMELHDDTILEGVESVIISLKEPYFLLIDEPSTVTVFIDDSEDEPKYFFKRDKYEVYENMTELILSVKKFGDLSRESRLECITQNGEAEGGNSLDFLPQPGIPSPVKFFPGDDESFCTIMIYDDDIMEPAEDFWVKLESRHRELSRTHITILPDERDYPIVSFVSDAISVREDEGELHVPLIVKGQREVLNASVAVIAKSVSAKANKDFIFKKNIVFIRPEVDKYHITVKIIDDSKAMMYEGSEDFLLQLVHPRNCTLGFRNTINITIEDDSDVPVIQFTRQNYTVKEPFGKLNLEIDRQGDMMGGFSVICFTQEKSATNEDFNLENNQTFQVVKFLPGEMKRNCTISIIDDDVFESKEFFTVHLKPQDQNIRIGPRSHAIVEIADEEDKIVFFRKSHYFVKEPQLARQNISLKVQVSREGDPTSITDVRVYTKDGTARSGEDYVGKSAVMTFEPGQRSFTCDIQILSDREVEIKEYFTIYLEVLNKEETLYSRKTIVYIYDAPQPGSAMFPAAPIVLSANEFNNEISDRKSLRNDEEFVQGSPLVCITVCNKRHFLSSRFEGWCVKNGIKDSNTKFSWQIENRQGTPVDIPYPLFFANTSCRLLEGVYVRGGTTLRCGVTPLIDSVAGKISYSELVSISRSPGACPPPSQNMIGAEPFIAQISYSEESAEKSRLVKVSVSLPHYDGMFPAISTHPLGDAVQVLSSFTPRPQIHKCSNIITEKEMETKYGFLSSNPEYNTAKSVLQLIDYRGEDAINLYKHLDLESCLWNFEAYYTIDEAVNYCGAALISDSNLYETEKTSVTLEVPLYVSYYTFSVFGWQHTDTSIVLRLTFLYEGSVLSDEGVVKQEDEALEGILHPTSMHISQNGSLVVFFKTTPRFPGSFIPSNEEGLQSYVRCVEHPEMPISLKLINNRTHTSDAEQYWVFYSDYTSEDYTGRYEVSLIPCLRVDSSELCTPRQNIIFPLDIHLQQVSDPVLKKYTLNTTFHLIKKREAQEPVQESSMFEPGDEVYGFISMDPPQSHLEILIDQCYVCSGRNGRTPKYNPKKKEYGCLMESPDLQYSVKILDRHKPGATPKSFQQMYFNASLLRRNENISLTPFGNAENVDIFYFDVTPLFNLKAAKVWFIHCTFTIRSVRSEHVKKRSIFEGVRSAQISKKGTNMRRLVLQDVKLPKPSKQRIFLGGRTHSTGKPEATTHQSPVQSQVNLTQEQFHLIWLLSVFFVLFLSLILTIVLLCYIVHVKKELSSKKTSNFSNVDYRECQTNEY